MNTIGEKLKITVFGQSHSEAIGVVIDGLPAGETIDLVEIQTFMDRRAPGKNAFSTTRKEPDQPEIVSGLVEGMTCGAPLTMIIRNQNAHSQDYSEIERKPRPMHADYPAWVKTGGARDVRGGGEYSGRLTAPICFAGAVALQILKRKGIAVGAHIASIGTIQDERYDPVNVTPKELSAAGKKDFPVLNDEAGKQMQEEILSAKKDLDSIGGTIECAVTGLEAGLGEPMFEGIENRISHYMFGIPAVKGIEFGAGFAASEMRGSQHNDAYILKEGTVVTETNRHGGILGGMTTGMPVVFRLAMKPTPSIGKGQKTVDLYTMEETTLTIKGRHDPCIVPRAVPVVEASAAIAVLDLLLTENKW